MTNPMSKLPAHKLRNTFFSGLFFLVPIGITYWILDLLVIKIQGYARPFVEKGVGQFELTSDLVVPEWFITVTSFGLVLIFVFLIGIIANIYLGKQLFEMLDRMLMRLPVIRQIYGGSKQIIEAIQMQRGESFKRVVMLEYPRRGIWVLGFVTNESLKASQDLYQRDLIAVFVPSTPNPTTGFLLYLDPYDVYLVDMNVNEAITLIISAGLVVPKLKKNPPITMGEALEY